jgi:DNA repair protein SbcC/Rad50
MRPLRLDLHGFTIFREPTTVDFTDADFFALVGPTGSGKSTVLDAICFALYGTVPRWGDRRRIENALAPSAAEARVRLVFEASGVRFVATRVVRRDGKGKVATAHAGLEQLPPGFDLRLFDAAPAQRGETLGTVLAGTWSEMESAVFDAVGLPYEQFTSCVVLPQGEFARFLHAKPAERQEILVNLLGLHVYQQVGERAGIRHREAEARVAATRNLLGDLTDADDAALASAERAVATATELVIAIEAELPALDEARGAGENAAAEMGRVERELAALAVVRPPAALASLGDEVVAARDAAARAQVDVHEAEDREEKARAELTAAGDRTALTRLVDAYAERVRHERRAAELASAVTKAAKEHEAMAAKAAAVKATVDKSTAAVRTAQAGVETAQTADRAATLRVHLVKGEPCPVCEQPVARLPKAPASPALRAAREKLGKAEQAAQVAHEAAQNQDRTLRELDRRLAGAQAQHQESVTRLEALTSTLEGAPALSTVESSLKAIAKHEKAVAASADGVRDARRAVRAAGSRLQTAEAQLREAWLGYDRARDSAAALGPPAADRDDLVGSWQALAEWAAAATRERTHIREATVAVAEAALAALTDVVTRLAGLLQTAGAPAATSHAEPASYRQAAALAVERATAARQRVLERREQAARLVEQVAQHEREAQVAKALAQHLRANQFERWLLTEALDALVAGASQILRELSGGRYDLAHDKGEFAVIDHGDASLRRAVRTLSGGETFQASLALALALSEQLAGLSSATASLESIMLDEGFGSLDPDTLDMVATTLENLAARGDRMVGVVTHVAGLAERIPVRFEVSRGARGAAHIVRRS